MQNLNFNGYLIRFNTLDDKRILKLLFEHFNEEWIIEVIDESYKIYHLYYDGISNFSFGKIWDFAHNNLTEEIRYIEPIFKIPSNDNVQTFDFKCDDHPNGTENKNWCLDQMHIKQVWDYSLKTNSTAYGKGIKIGHTDTGYTHHESIYHSQLLVKDGWNVYDGKPDAYDFIPNNKIFANRGHGTSTASCIIGNGKHGIYGIAPQANIVPIRVADGVLVEEKYFIKGIAHAIRKDCLVTSSSLALLRVDNYSQAVEDILQEALQQGIIPFGAGGQAIGVPDFLKDIYPSRSPYCISCTSSTIFKYPWRKAFATSYIEVGAPGESVNIASVSSSNDINLTERSCGTSFSTAFMAGVAALWYAHHGPQFLHDKYGKRKAFYLFKSLLNSYGIVCPPGWNTSLYGPGIVDAYALIRAPLSISVEELEKIELETIQGAKNIRLEKIKQILDIELSDIHPSILEEIEKKVNLQQELLFHMYLHHDDIQIFKQLLSKTSSAKNLSDIISNNTFSQTFKNLIQ